MKSFRPPQTTGNNNDTTPTTTTTTHPSSPLSPVSLYHRRRLRGWPAISTSGPTNTTTTTTNQSHYHRHNLMKYDDDNDNDCSCPNHPPRSKVAMLLLLLLGGGSVVVLLRLEVVITTTFPWPPPSSSSSRKQPPPPATVLLRLPRQRHDDEAIRITFDHNIHVMQQQYNHTNNNNNTVTLHYHGVEELAVLSRPWFTYNGNAFCSTIQKERNKYNQNQNNNHQKNPLFIIVNITLSCRNVFEKGHVGTGNYLAFFYGLRWTAQVLGNIDIHLTCDDAAATQRELILPWIMGFFPGRTIATEEPLPPVSSRYHDRSEKLACADFRYLPLIHMVPEMQQDLRRMAIALVGIPPQPWSSSEEGTRRHPSETYAQQHVWPLQTRKKSGAHSPDDNHDDDDDYYYYHRSIGSSVLLLPPPQQNDQPMYSTPAEFQMDDVTIHFRCGDFLSDKWHHIETSTFADYVDPIITTIGSVRSIGILTQSLEIPKNHTTTTGSSSPMEQQQRIDDLEPTVVSKCKILVHSLVAYIQQHCHPNNVTIRIHNDRNETMALTYARMILARQSITGMTSFGELGTIATFGTGYIRSPGQWIRPAPPMEDTTTNNSNVVWYPSSKIASFQYIKQLWTANGTQAVLRWFWNGVVPTDGNYCGRLHNHHHHDRDDDDDTCE